MTQSLTERLQEREAETRARIDSLTASELQRLGASLRSESDAALASIRSVTAESAASVTALFARDTSRLRRFWPWIVGTVVVSWATSLVLLGLLLWHWMSPPSTATLLSGAGVDPVFTAEGRTYLLLPQGSQALRCQQGRGPWVPCVALPMQAQSTAPSLERTLQEQEQAEEAEAQGVAPHESGRLLWPPAARPMTRPAVPPGTQTGTQRGQEG